MRDPIERLIVSIAVQIINRLKELLAKHGSSGDLARNA
jgi:hypothetical protein